MDSSALTAFASRHYGGRLATYSAGFDFARDEGELQKAQRVAAFFGTGITRFTSAVPMLAIWFRELVQHHDMPFSDTPNIRA
mgnify:CR=1 FL=1